MGNNKKIYKTTHVQSHDTTSRWERASYEGNYTPYDGQIIIYDDSAYNSAMSGECTVSGNWKFNKNISIDGILSGTPVDPALGAHLFEERVNFSANGIEYTSFVFTKDYSGDSVQNGYDGMFYFNVDEHYLAWGKESSSSSKPTWSNATDDINISFPEDEQVVSQKFMMFLLSNATQVSGTKQVNISAKRIKIGDGTTKVNDLPFIDDALLNYIKATVSGGSGTDIEASPYSLAAKGEVKDGEDFNNITDIGFYHIHSGHSHPNNPMVSGGLLIVYNDPISKPNLKSRLYQIAISASEVAQFIRVRRVSGEFSDWVSTTPQAYMSTVPNGTDLDTMETPATYWLSTLNTYTNAPFVGSGGGMLLVYNDETNATVHRAYQFFVDHETKIISLRIRTGGGIDASDPYKDIWNLSKGLYKYIDGEYILVESTESLLENGRIVHDTSNGNVLSVKPDVDNYLPVDGKNILVLGDSFRGEEYIVINESKRLNTLRASTLVTSISTTDDTIKSLYMSAALSFAYRKTITIIDDSGETLSEGTVKSFCDIGKLDLYCHNGSNVNSTVNVTKRYSPWSALPTSSDLSNKVDTKDAMLKDTFVTAHKNGNLFNGEWVVGYKLAGNFTSETYDDVGAPQLLKNELFNSLAIIPVKPNTTYSCVLERTEGEQYLTHDNTPIGGDQYYFKIATADRLLSLGDEFTSYRWSQTGTPTKAHTFTTNSTDKYVYIQSSRALQIPFVFSEGIVDYYSNSAPVYSFTDCVEVDKEANNNTVLMNTSETVGTIEKSNTLTGKFSVTIDAPEQDNSYLLNRVFDKVKNFTNIFDGKYLTDGTYINNNKPNLGISTYQGTDQNGNKITCNSTARVEIVYGHKYLIMRDKPSAEYNSFGKKYNYWFKVALTDATDVTTVKYSYYDDCSHYNDCYIVDTSYTDSSLKESVQDSVLNTKGYMYVTTALTEAPAMMILDLGNDPVVSSEISSLINSREITYNNTVISMFDRILSQGYNIRPYSYTGTYLGGPSGGKFSVNKNNSVDTSEIPIVMGHSYLVVYEAQSLLKVGIGDIANGVASLGVVHSNTSTTNNWILVDTLSGRFKTSSSTTWKDFDKTLISTTLSNLYVCCGDPSVINALSRPDYQYVLDVTELTDNEIEGVVSDISLVMSTNLMKSSQFTILNSVILSKLSNEGGLKSNLFDGNYLNVDILSNVKCIRKGQTAKAVKNLLIKNSTDASSTAIIPVKPNTYYTILMENIGAEINTEGKVEFDFVICTSNTLLTNDADTIHYPLINKDGELVADDKVEYKCVPIPNTTGFIGYATTYVDDSTITNAIVSKTTGRTKCIVKTNSNNNFMYIKTSKTLQPLLQVVEGTSDMPANIPSIQIDGYNDSNRCGMTVYKWFGVDPRKASYEADSFIPQVIVKDGRIIQTFLCDTSSSVNLHGVWRWYNTKIDGEVGHALSDDWDNKNGNKTLWQKTDCEGPIRRDIDDDYTSGYHGDERYSDVTTIGGVELPKIRVVVGEKLLNVEDSAIVRNCDNVSLFINTDVLYSTDAKTYKTSDGKVDADGNIKNVKFTLMQGSTVIKSGVKIKELTDDTTYMTLTNGSYVCNSGYKLFISNDLTREVLSASFAKGNWTLKMDYAEPTLRNGNPVKSYELDTYYDDTVYTSGNYTNNKDIYNFGKFSYIIDKNKKKHYLGKLPTHTEVTDETAVGVPRRQHIAKLNKDGTLSFVEVTAPAHGSDVKVGDLIVYDGAVREVTKLDSRHSGKTVIYDTIVSDVAFKRNKQLTITHNNVLINTTWNYIGIHDYVVTESTLSGLYSVWLERLLGVSDNYSNKFYRADMQEKPDARFNGKNLDEVTFYGKENFTVKIKSLVKKSPHYNGSITLFSNQRYKAYLKDIAK